MLATTAVFVSQVESGWTIAKLCATLSWFEVILKAFCGNVDICSLVVLLIVNG